MLQNIGDEDKFLSGDDTIKKHNQHLIYIEFNEKNKTYEE